MNAVATVLTAVIAGFALAKPALGQHTPPRIQALRACAASRWDLLDGELDSARRSLAEAAEHATRTQSKTLLTWVEQRTAWLTACTAERQRLATLDPTDGATISARGAFRALWLGDLDAGIDLAATGSSRRWRALSAAENVPKLDARECERLGDLWLRQPAEGPDFAQFSIRRRALDWYRRGVSRAEGAARDKLAAKTRKLMLEMLPKSGPGHAVFKAKHDLADWSMRGGKWSRRNGKLIGESGDDRARATYRYGYSEIFAVRIRGSIASVNNENFRCSVGPTSVIFNWECAKENHFRYVPRGDVSAETVRGHLFRRGKEHEVLICDVGERVQVCLDGRVVWEREIEAPLHGAISVHPAMSRIRVRGVEVLGVLDTGEEPVKPSHRTY